MVWRSVFGRSPLWDSAHVGVPVRNVSPPANEGALWTADASAPTVLSTDSLAKQQELYRYVLIKQASELRSGSLRS